MSGNWPQEVAGQASAPHGSYIRRKVERHTPFTVMVVNVNRKPITLAKGALVGTAEPYRVSVYKMSKEDLLQLQRSSNLSSIQRGRPGRSGLLDRRRLTPFPRSRTYRRPPISTRRMFLHI